MTGRDNQGEGNRTADRRYRESVEDFVDSGEVEKREQERRDIPEETREELEKAEERGKDRANSGERDETPSG